MLFCWQQQLSEVFAYILITSAAVTTRIIHLLTKHCSNNQVNLLIWRLIKGTMPGNRFEIVKVAYETQKIRVPSRANGRWENYDRSYCCRSIGP